MLLEIDKYLEALTDLKNIVAKYDQSYEFEYISVLNAFLANAIIYNRMDTITSLMEQIGRFSDHIMDDEDEKNRE